MRYHAYELAHACFAPWRLGIRGLRAQLDLPFNPLAMTPVGRSLAAACEIFENVTRRYGKPDFAIAETAIEGIPVAVQEEVVLQKPFCALRHFARDDFLTGGREDPRVLIVAPLSGHYATLLRGTVAAMLPEHEVTITDWVDAREVPLSLGGFDLDDFIDYLVDFLQFLGPETHVIAVCQPSVPALAASALMAAADDPCRPASLTLIGGPIDTRRNPTVVNQLIADKPLAWFEQAVISHVPFPNPGFFRRVYPGFVQLGGFMTMNLERHVNAHLDQFRHLVEGDGDSAQQHRGFYEEFLAVMDLPAEFYLQTLKTVFQDHDLPEGRMRHRGRPVDCGAIRDIALMTVEGARDDICPPAQTEAAHDLCAKLPAAMKRHHVQEGVGHFGVFNGSRWRSDVQPRIRDMIREVERERARKRT